MNYHERIETLNELAFIDKSGAYSIDVAGVYMDPKDRRFVLITAVGWSCWDPDSDWDEEKFETLGDLKNALFGTPNGSIRRYVVGIEDAKTLYSDTLNSMNDWKKQ